MLTRIGDEARAALGNARFDSERHLELLVERTRADTNTARRESRNALGEVARAGRQSVLLARNASDALFREVNGQGPEKTLARGFAHVRDGEGRTIKSAATLQPGDAFTVTFRDGDLPARVRNEETKE